MKNKYSGIKKVDKWIAENTFHIHEYAEGRNEEIYQKLISDITDVLCTCTRSIKISKTTKFKDVVNLNFTNNRNGKKFILIIHNNKPKRIPYSHIPKSKQK